MTIENMSDPGAMIGAIVYGVDGSKLGQIDAIYYDSRTNHPEWVAVKGGHFEGHVSLVPLRLGTWESGTLTVCFGKCALEMAPHHDPDTVLSLADEFELYRYYGMSAGQSASGALRDDPRHGRAEGPQCASQDLTGPTTDEPTTSYPEQMQAGAERHRSGRARLRKHIGS